MVNDKLSYSIDNDFSSQLNKEITEICNSKQYILPKTSQNNGAMKRKHSEESDTEYMDDLFNSIDESYSNCIKKPKRYDEEFKRQLVNLHINTGNKPAVTAKAYNIPDSTFRDWINKFGPNRKKMGFNTPIMSHTQSLKFISTSTPVPYDSFSNKSSLKLPEGFSYISPDNESEIIIDKNNIAINGSELAAIEKSTLNLSTDTDTIEKELTESLIL